MVGGVRVVWFVMGGRQRVTWGDELMITVSRPVYCVYLSLSMSKERETDMKIGG